MSQKVACISLNLDSIGHAIGKSPLKNDPTFNIVFNRIENIIDKYDIKLSIFVIGKDLEDKNNLKYVSEWHKNGHEIGNHTYTHPINFGVLDKEIIYNEIKKTHELIEKAIDEKPVGFIAPNWNSSKRVLSVLNDLDYKYDHSFFSSPILLLGLVKLFYNFLKVAVKQRELPQTYTLKEIFQRKDYLTMFTGKTKPFVTKESYYRSFKGQGIKIYPIPSWFRLPYWLTIDFVFPRRISNMIFERNVNNSEFFYLLIHPADFLSEKDLENIEGVHSFERMNVPINDKLELFEQRLKILVNNGFDFKTFNQLDN